VAPVEAEAMGTVAAVRLGERYEILPAAPRSEFASPSTEAYRAIDRTRSGAALYALVTEPGVPPRAALLDPIAGLQAETLVRPVGWGVVDWPPRGRRVFVIVFEEPGTRLVTDLTAPFTPLSDEDILGNVLPSTLAALKALTDIGVTHRAVRPTNLFRTADGGIVLGECVSLPPAAAQPIAYEPIESGLAHPMGRGAGIHADDLYALGMTVATLLLGRDPVAGVPEDELLAAKIARGSIAALLAGTSLPSRMLEPVRGLLADDARERWTLHDLAGWLQTRKAPLRQMPAQRRSERPFDFEGQGHVTARPLARALVHNPAAAIRPIRSGDLEAWLVRSLGDSEMAAAVARNVEASEAGNPASEAHLVARVAMALDPGAPVRHADLAAMLDGFGPALAATFRAGTAASAIADAIMARLPQYWIALQGPLRPEQVPLLKTVDRLRLMLEDRRLGYGLARVLYELNPGQHCLSPAIEREHVMDGAAIVPALERAAADKRLADPLIDRHLAAFVAARCRGAGSEWLEELTHPAPEARTLGTLRVLVYLDRLGGRHGAPGLAARLERELPPAIERFRSRTRRSALRATLSKFAAAGDLGAMLAAVTDLAELRRDEAEYRAARSEQATIRAELATLSSEAAIRSEHAAELGGTMSFALASVLAAAVAVGSLVMWG
jgi:eukaryotic-like serine/threonine-protein kinase